MMPIAPGFDAKWDDVSDYIRGITQEIWEDRGLSTLHGYYSDELVVRSAASVVKGNTGIVAATQSTLAEFQDRELPGEDVIWCWADDAHSSFLSSHRLICWASHNGEGIYGKPTGRRLRYRILADCYCAENQVRDEWLVRDQSAIVQQMGRSPAEWTRDLIRAEGGPEDCVRPFTPENDLPGPYAGKGTKDKLSAEVEGLFTSLLSGNIGELTRAYDPAAELHYPAHVTAHGHEGARAFWMSLCAAFPTAAPAIHHRIGRNDQGMPPRVALRWSLKGKHDGPGAFGPATGAPVYIMGITHVEMGPRGVRREWTLIDETAIWKQILMHTGSL